MKRRLPYIIIFILFIAISIFLYFLFSMNYVPKNKELKFTNSPLNYCSSNFDCYIYSYDSCQCPTNVVVNKKYKDSPELYNNFPITPSEECLIVCTPGNTFPKAAYCVNGRCGIEYEKLFEK